MTASQFLGWRILHQVGPLQQSFLPHAGRPLLVTGRNGTGKSTLLAAITSRGSSVQVEYSGVPRRFAPHLALLREFVEGGPSGSLDAAVVDYRGQIDLDDLLLRVSSSPDDGTWIEEQFNCCVRTGVSAGAIRISADPDPGSGSDHPSIELPLGRRASTEPMQRWVIPSDADAAVVAQRTSSAFQVWVADLLTACGEVSTPALNPLIVKQGTVERPVLDLANLWAAAVSARSAARFRAATGLDCHLTCSPAENFAWMWKERGSWLAPSMLSSGLKRWFALSVLETLREYESILKAPAESIELTDLLTSPPDWAFPTAPVDVFAGEPFWLAVDEPELHLYPTEENHLADALARQASAGRMLVATHSLQLASAFIGSADLVTFTDPGIFTLHEPSLVVEEALGDLARHSPAIVSRMSVLYVEGEWDQRVLEALFGDELTLNRVLLSPLHGVNESDRIVGTVWSRMLGLPIYILFDRLTESEVAQEWDQMVDSLGNPSADRAQLAARLRSRAEGDGPNEQRALVAMLAMVVDQRLEGSVRILSHGLSDILQAVHPRRFNIDADSWTQAGYTGPGSFKSWLQRRTNRKVEQASWLAWKNEVAERWDAAGVESLRSSLAPMLSASPQPQLQR